MSRRRSGCSRAQQRFLGTEDAKVPYIIGVAGSVAVGKSTTARVLQALLARWPNVPKVDLVTTDGFLLPNAVLEREGLMEKKGFPESYDLPALLRFLADVKAGRRPVRAPVYSHLVYDVMPNQWVEVDRPDILIVEGLNVLQTGRLPKDGKAIPFVSDFFDFSIYLDADEDVLQQLVRRPLPDAARDRVPRSEILLPSLFEARPTTRRSTTATSIWERINLVNLHENILPTRQRADLILKKGESHLVEEVALRKLYDRRASGWPAALRAFTRSYAATVGMRRCAVTSASASALGEPLAVERLDQEAVHAGGKAGLAVLGEGIGGERDDRRARACRVRLRRRGCGASPRGRRCPACARPSARDRKARRRARAASQASSAAAPLAAMVGRWPSRVSSARVSSALISLSSATRTREALAVRGRAASHRRRLGIGGMPRRTRRVAEAAPRARRRAPASPDSR